MEEITKNLDWPEDDAPREPRLQALWLHAKENWVACIARASRALTTGRLTTAAEWIQLAGNIERDWYQSNDLTRDAAGELCRRTQTVLDVG